MFKKLSLMVAVLFASIAFAGFGLAFTPHDPDPNFYDLTDPFFYDSILGQVNVEAAAEKPYVLTPAARPDTSRMTALLSDRQTAVYENPSEDGFVINSEVHWGETTIWASGDEKDKAVTFTLLESRDVVIYAWKIGEQWYFAFADGDIYLGDTFGIEVLSVAPFNNRIRFTIYNDAGDVPLATREFTVAGMKPAESPAQ
ncbi:MAG: hypothetical protein HYT22_00510 [Candidatus Niyogibacteria bacterium]|nr:hypothetical protein [Candidatus Niyogibacteria bacterium]